MDLENVKDYYGRVLSTNKDLKTSACCSSESLPAEFRAVASMIHPEVIEKFYGCGSPLPPNLSGRTVLDLGCGTGRDVYLLSHAVGENGKVIGIDMTDSQLSVAKKHLEFHTKKFGFSKSNVEFHQGYIEDLAACGLENESIDLVVSNCVTNLSPDKPKLFAEIWRVLRNGGELYFSDVFVDRRLPKSAGEDPVLLGECLGGAMYKEDFRRLMYDLGCKDFRVMSQTPIDLRDPDVIKKVGYAQFSSVTIRAFKLDIEDRCEDFGQVAYYRGTIPNHPHSFTLDDHHTFFTGRPMLVCGNTADMVSKTAYGEHFFIQGNKDTHFGLFDCGPVASPNNGAACASGACC